MHVEILERGQGFLAYFLGKQGRSQVPSLEENKEDTECFLNIRCKS